jgi:hypothetical protein
MHLWQRAAFDSLRFVWFDVLVQEITTARHLVNHGDGLCFLRVRCRKLRRSYKGCLPARLKRQKVTGAPELPGGKPSEPEPYGPGPEVPANGGASPPRKDPLVLDLDGDGIETTSTFLHSIKGIGMRAFRRRLIYGASSLFVTAVGVGVLSACGGGGGGHGDGGQTQSTPTTPTTPTARTTISGTLTNTATGSGVAGAEVSLGTNDSTTQLSTISDVTGKYTLTVDTSRLNTDTTIVVTVSAPGYQTYTAQFPNLSASGGTVEGSTAIQQATASEYYPAAGIHLTHLGDGVASGTPNSKLQMGGGSFPTSKTITFGPAPDAAALSAYSTFNVYVDMRGVEASTRQDTVIVFQGASDGSANVYQREWSGNGIPDGALDGTLTPYIFAIPVSALKPGGGDLNVRITSGSQVGSVPPDDIDDFEFVNVHARFE